MRDIAGEVCKEFQSWIDSCAPEQEIEAMAWEVAIKMIRAKFPASSDGPPDPRKVTPAMIERGAELAANDHDYLATTIDKFPAQGEAVGDSKVLGFTESLKIHDAPQTVIYAPGEEEFNGAKGPWKSGVGNPPITEKDWIKRDDVLALFKEE